MAFKRPPSLPIARSNDELITVYNQAITDLEQYLLEITQPAETGFTTSNVTPNKSLDPTSANLATVANTLATLIDALKSKGLIG
tara:strand:+ start:5142 stop:5393 length:252 start_codon:yes stop_codon:yes gene_type:complete